MFFDRIVVVNNYILISRFRGSSGKGGAGVAQSAKAAAKKTERRPRSAANSEPVDRGPLPTLLGYAIRRSQIAIFQDFMRSMGATGIRPAQYSILTVIARNPGLKQAQVSDSLGIERARLVLVLNELEERGLARRVLSTTDRRSHALFLTPEGERLLAELDHRVAEHEARLIAKLGQPGRRQLLDLLSRLQDD